MAIIKRAVIVILIMSTTPALCQAEGDSAEGDQEYTFNSNFLVGASSQTDLKRFDTTSLQPGTYSVDVYNNGEWKGLNDLQVTRDAKGHAGVCYTREMLENFGIDVTKLNKEKHEDANFCGNLSEWSDEPTLQDTLSSAQLRLDLSVPQQFENEQYRGYVAPARWDKGISALNISYMADYYDIIQADNGDKGRNAFMGVQAYLSSAGWQLHHNGNANWTDKEGAKWTSNETTLTRPLAAVKSLLTLGQFGSNGDSFDSVNLLGASLATDDMMYPDNMISYAPVVNGVAETNALVTIHQNNNLIYQTTVAPGPFSLNNIYPSGVGSDLIVTVHEADGREKTFSVPYNSVVKLQHPDMSDYSITVGEANDDRLRNKPIIGVGTWRYGLNNTFTVYGGVSGFNDYQAYQAGSGMNTVIGGLALDVTQAKTRLASSDVSGQQYRLMFNRTFTESNTGVSLQFSQATENYYSLPGALYIIDQQKQGMFADYAPKKTSVSLTINQQFPEGWGNLYLSGSVNRYWHRSGTEEQYSVGYGNSWGKLNWGINLQRVYTNPNSSSVSGIDPQLDNGLAPARRKKDDTISLNISYPLSFGEDRTASVSSNTTFKNGAFDSTQLGLNGSLDKENTLLYGVTSSANKNNDYDVGLNGNYIAPWSSLTASYSYGNTYQQIGAGASGTMLVHSGGVTLSSEMGPTLTLAEAKGAKGASIAGSTSRFDSNGYALTSALQPYRVNNIEVDMKGASEDVNFDSTNMQVAPYEGSVTKVVFKTNVTKSRMLVARRPGNVALPFGAEIRDEKDESIGFVGQGSTLFISSDTAKRARIGWDGGRCEVNLMQPELKEQVCL
ncbi:fimbria/pilus outer membrane usher protein [Leclercia sp.]|uniref:fimbria/pilus outer membrane usher protein n=1 Tax=Leclercia sp. TaxID=1898428 RepID=UPI002FDDF812